MTDKIKYISTSRVKDMTCSLCDKAKRGYCAVVGRSIDKDGYCRYFSRKVGSSRNG